MPTPKQPDDGTIVISSFNKGNDEEKMFVLRQDSIREAVQSLRMGVEALNADCAVFLGEELYKEVMAVKVDVLLEYVFSDMQAILHNSDAVRQFFDLYFKQIDCKAWPETEALRYSMEQEILILAELVINTFTEEHDYDGTLNYYLYRVLYSGGLCFVPGDRRSAMRHRPKASGDRYKGHQQRLRR